MMTSGKNVTVFSDKTYYIIICDVTNKNVFFRQILEKKNTISLSVHICLSTFSGVVSIREFFACGILGGVCHSTSQFTVYRMVIYNVFKAHNIVEFTGFDKTQLQSPTRYMPQPTMSCFSTEDF